MSFEFVKQALKWAERGFHVYPYDRETREPHVRWRKGTPQEWATTDIEQIITWWKRWPEAGVGCDLRKSGFVLVDVDIKRGKPGFESLESLGALPETLTVTSESGGKHLYYKWSSEGGTNKIECLRGLDIIFDSGFLYDSIVHDTEPVELPETIKTLLAEKIGKSPTTAPSVKGGKYEDLSPSDKARCDAYTDKALDARVQELKNLWDESKPEHGAWDNTVQKVLRRLYELAFRCPWSYVTEEIVEEIIALNVPLPDDDKWTAARRAKCIKSARDSQLMKLEQEGELAIPDENVESQSETWGKTARLLWRGADTIKPKRTKWVWQDMILSGQVNLLAGMEDSGKSTIALWLAAQVTRGDLEGEYYGKPRNVLYFATEDSDAETIVPRLIAAGADLSRVCINPPIEGVRDEYALFDLISHRDALRNFITAYDVALSIFDPLLSNMGQDTDTYKARAVRKVLEPLRKVGEETTCGFLGIMHLNRVESDDAGRRWGESKAFRQVARHTLLALRDKDNGTYHLNVDKANLVKKGKPGLIYEFTEQVISTDEGPTTTSTVKFVGESNLNADDLLASEMKELDPKLQEIWKFIKQGAGVYLSKDLEKFGRITSAQKAKLRINSFKAEGSKTSPFYTYDKERYTETEARKIANGLEAKRR
ncbi:hypothetical protein GCM10010404_85520 [Nonomuraea africana]|uniref:DNA primase/polymerase bifunctional N-terminal domain-containing protein n=1 Tax=Nonomuraea africana TaxID=46171 RepID=A0ABR9K8C5_9ACTN|nr:AAA family ATPase [Nonomuraea africana]MBE1558258.1 hypothetical protein [Nonomuraea africana]